MLKSVLTTRGCRLLVGFVVALSLWIVPAPTRSAVADATTTYTNPLSIQIPGDGRVESCADPSIIHARRRGDTAWYIYCTTDPLNGHDRNAHGDFNFHLIPQLKSYDLVHWVYAGDAFTARPAWVKSDAGLWAPDIHFFNGMYYLYYTASDTVAGGSAIGVALSAKPTGPWTDSGGPVVEPHAAACCPGSKRWVFDPMVVQDNGQKYIFYGSYFGGISVRKLSPNGLHSDPASQTQIAISNRYEASWVMKHGGYWYFMGSATNCCNGPLSGYSVFAGRSKNVLGPYVDRVGAPLLAGRVGGTPVISMNGNKWVGTGHNAVFTDFAGQDWFLYHAINRFDPYFTGATGFSKRPVLMDRLDWIGGWPTVRGGFWASDTGQQAPVAQPGEGEEPSPVVTPPPDVPGAPIAGSSDEFNDTTLSKQWTWVRPPAPTSYGVGAGTFRFDTQAADLYVDNNTASVLTEPAPRGDYIVETRVKLNVPPEGCCQNFVQAGLVIYHDDDNYIKLAHVSIFETRQTEFAKELKLVPDGYPRYGNTVVGPPGDWTYLRIVKQMRGTEETYRAYTNNGAGWVRGGVWTHHLGDGARIGLVSMGGSGFTANFDYVRVYRLSHDPAGDAQPSTAGGAQAR